MKWLKESASRQLKDLGGFLPFVYCVVLAFLELLQALGMATAYASRASSKSSIKLLRFASADHTHSSGTKRRDMLNGKHIVTCDGVRLDGM